MPGPVGAVLLLVLAGCAGPPVLERQVLGYDEVAKRLDERLLLLNIARVANDESVHFTSTSSIAATFNWTTTIGAAGRLNRQSASNFLDLNIGASASENPTFSIVPISGEEFTKRVVTPFTDGAFEFLVFQGGRIDQVMRLMAAGLEVQGPDGRFVRFIENDPRRPDEYQEFRWIARRLQWLNDHRQLFVRPLVFEERLIRDFRQVPRAEDINNGFDKGLRWRQKPDGHYELTRLSAGRVLVSNFDPMALTDQQRSELNDRIRKNPAGFVYFEIRSDGPGGDRAMQGAVKLRSMLQILGFIGAGIHEAREFDVPAEPGTGGIPGSATSTLKINVTELPPGGEVPSVEMGGRYYSVNDTAWDRAVFAHLNVLFQTTVGPTREVGLPITISK